MAGDGRNPVAQAQAQTNCGGASLVQNGYLEFWKWWFGERRVDPLERE